ncbi:hypothetical protein DXF85_03000 [Citrobacter pasteurii]|uniref:Uncharacterized protein n=1 Tax=Citrobacter pasteurii TaxID=1563222 RepID=A0A6N6K9J4_9ENTR|nr:hypothetical protein DXF85_03000 [Citrobacter pasteurii]
MFVPWVCHAPIDVLRQLTFCVINNCFVNAVNVCQNSKLNVVLLIRNAKVVGSTPIIGTIFLCLRTDFSHFLYQAQVV